MSKRQSQKRTTEIGKLQKKFRKSDSAWAKNARQKMNKLEKLEKFPKLKGDR